MLPETLLADFLLFAARAGVLTKRNKSRPWRAAERLHLALWRKPGRAAGDECARNQTGTHSRAHRGIAGTMNVGLWNVSVRQRSDRNTL